MSSADVTRVECRFVSNRVNPAELLGARSAKFINLQDDLLYRPHWSWLKTEHPNQYRKPVVEARACLFFTAG